MRPPQDPTVQNAAAAVAAALARDQASAAIGRPGGRPSEDPLFGTDTSRFKRGGHGNHDPEAKGEDALMADEAETGRVRATGLVVGVVPARVGAGGKGRRLGVGEAAQVALGPDAEAALDAQGLSYASRVGLCQNPARRRGGTRNLPKGVRVGRGKRAGKLSTAERARVGQAPSSTSAGVGGSGGRRPAGVSKGRRGRKR